MDHSPPGQSGCFLTTRRRSAGSRGSKTPWRSRARTQASRLYRARRPDGLERGLPRPVPRGIRVKMRLHLGRQGPRDHPRGPPLPAPVEGRGHSPLARRSLGGFHPLRRLPARACGHTNRVCRIQPVPPRASRPPATARRGHPCAPVPCPDLSRASGCRRPWALPRCAHPEGDHPRGWLPGPQGDRCPRAAQTPESSSRRL